LQLAQAKQQQAEAEQQRVADEQFRRLIPAPQGQMRPGAAPMNHAQIESAVGTPGYGASSAQPSMVAPDPFQTLLYQAMANRQIKPMDYLNATKKDTTPIKLGAGEKLLRPGTYDTLAENPKEDTKDPYVRLLEQSGIDPKSPLGQQLLMAKAKKDSTHAPGVSVSYGAPVAGVDATGKPIFFQPGKDGGPPKIMEGVAPPKKETPAALQEKLAQNKVTLGKIDKALLAVDAYPEAFGLQNVAGDTLMQRADPKGVAARAMVADIAGQKIHDRSGAAVTVGETARLKPYVPNVTDSPPTVKKKLELFRAEYAAMQQAINSGASIDQAAAPSRTAPASGPVFLGFEPAGGK
jgi:hypothetical protein